MTPPVATTRTTSGKTVPAVTSHTRVPTRGPSDQHRSDPNQTRGVPVSPSASFFFLPCFKGTFTRQAPSSRLPVDEWVPSPASKSL